MSNLVSIVSVYETVFAVALVTGAPVVATTALVLNARGTDALDALGSGVLAWGGFLSLLWFLNFVRLGETTVPAMVVVLTLCTVSLGVAYGILLQVGFDEGRALQRTVLSWPVALAVAVAVQFAVSGVATLISWSPPSAGVFRWYAGFLLLSLCVGGITAGVGFVVAWGRNKAAAVEQKLRT